MGSLSLSPNSSGRRWLSGADLHSTSPHRLRVNWGISVIDSGEFPRSATRAGVSWCEHVPLPFSFCGRLLRVRVSMIERRSLALDNGVARAGVLAPRAVVMGRPSAPAGSQRCAVPQRGRARRQGPSLSSNNPASFPGPAVSATATSTRPMASGEARRHHVGPAWPDGKEFASGPVIAQKAVSSVG